MENTDTTEVTTIDGWVQTVRTVTTYVLIQDQIDNLLAQDTSLAISEQNTDDQKSSIIAARADIADQLTNLGYTA